MLVTRETDYAVRCMLYLAGNNGRVSSVAEVSTSMGIPRSFLAKIIQRLARAGLIRSERGRNGGIVMANSPSAVSLLDIMTAIQDASTICSCVVVDEKCTVKPSCPIRPLWLDLRRDMNRRLSEQTLDRLVQRREQARSLHSLIEEKQ